MGTKDSAFVWKTQEDEFLKAETRTFRRAYGHIFWGNPSRFLKSVFFLISRRRSNNVLALISTRGTFKTRTTRFVLSSHRLTKWRKRMPSIHCCVLGRLIFRTDGWRPRLCVGSRISSIEPYFNPKSFTAQFGSIYRYRHISSST